MGGSGVDASPAKMIGDPGRCGALDPSLQALQVIAIQPFGRSKIHGDAMLDDAITLEDPVESGQWTPAIHHEIFRDDLEPVHHRLALENMLIMRNAQTDADTVIGESIKSIGGHSKSVKKGPG